MLQNWLKPIKGHNGPVPALNVIPEPGRNRVNLITTVFILLSLAFGKPLKILYEDTLRWILCVCFNIQAVWQVLGGFFVSVYRILCMNVPTLVSQIIVQME